MEYQLTNDEVARIKAKGGNVAEAQEAKKKAWLEANPQRVMEYTKGECKCYADLAANGKPIILKCPLCRAAPELYEELVSADEVICRLCKIVNPQHATADYGKGCDWCGEREIRLKAIAKVEEK